MKLSDTQLVVLSAACKRADRNLLPLPANLKGGAQQKVVASLLAKGLIEEGGARPADPVWRSDEAGRLTLVATGAAFQALGIELQVAGDDIEADAPAQAANGGDGSGTPAGEPEEAEPAPQASKGAKPPKARTGTKQAQLIAMLQKPNGASLDEIVAATGWQAHTVRGAIAGALKKRLGLTVTSEKVEGRGRVYRVAV